MLTIFRINGTKLTLAAKGEFGAWGQGVVWSKDGKTLLAQSMADKSLDVLSFTGTATEKDRHNQGQRRCGRYSVPRLTDLRLYGRHDCRRKGRR